MLALLFNVVSFCFILKDAIQQHTFLNAGLFITELTVVIQGFSILLLLFVIRRQFQIERIRSISKGQVNQHE
jgi:hypothetical protein